MNTYDSYWGNPFGGISSSPLMPAASYLAEQTPGYSYPNSCPTSYSNSNYTTSYSPSNPTSIAYGYPVNTPSPYTFSKNVSINGIRLNDAELYTLQKGCPNGGPLMDGSFWYDRKTGCWGYERGPTVGWIMPGIAVGGDLALFTGQSQGTNVFVNGREVHPEEVSAMSSRGIQLAPGSYDMDSFGRLMNKLGINVAQLFSNPFAQQMSSLFSKLTQCVPQSISGVSHPQSGIVGPTGGNYGQQPGFPPQQYPPQQYPPQQSFSSPPSFDASSGPMTGMGGSGASSDPIQSLLSQFLGTGDKQKLNTMLSKYGKHLNSDMFRTFLTGYLKDMSKKGKFKGAKGKVLQTGIKMLIDHLGVERGLDDHMFDFSGTGLDDAS